jgi:hypothetical protein
MLPKMSPLKFIYAASGSAILVAVYVYVSAFQLDFEEWILSNVLLSTIFSLMGYLSYCSERYVDRWGGARFR